MILGDLYLRLNMKVKKSGSLKEYTKWIIRTRYVQISNVFMVTHAEI
jgi:hypothetical protein